MGAFWPFCLANRPLGSPNLHKTVFFGPISWAQKFGPWAQFWARMVGPSLGPNLGAKTDPQAMAALCSGLRRVRFLKNVMAAVCSGLRRVRFLKNDTFPQVEHFGGFILAWGDPPMHPKLQPHPQPSILAWGDIPPMQGPDAIWGLWVPSAGPWAQNWAEGPNLWPLGPEFGVGGPNYGPNFGPGWWAQLWAPIRAPNFEGPTPRRCLSANTQSPGPGRPISRCADPYYVDAS